MSEKQKDIGALWQNLSKSGNKYLSGSIEIDGTKHKIVVFANSYKEKETHPDYKIYLSQPQGTLAREEKAHEFKDDVPF